jgi:hypothetical protein
LNHKTPKSKRIEHVDFEKGYIFRKLILEEDGFIMKPDHNSHKYLHFTIMHKVSSNVRVREAGFVDEFFARPGEPIKTTTWNYSQNSFPWNITRPETDKETFSKRCPYCGENLEIEVQSFELMSSRHKRNRKIGIALIPLWLAFIPIGFIFTSIFFLIPIGMIGLLVSGAYISEVGNGFSPLGHLGHSEPPKGPFTGHYIQTVESTN